MNIPNCFHFMRSFLLVIAAVSALFAGSYLLRAEPEAANWRERAEIYAAELARLRTQHSWQAFEDCLESRQTFLDSAVQASAAGDEQLWLRAEQMRGYLMLAHTKMKYNIHDEAALPIRKASRIAADIEQYTNGNDTLLMILAEAQASAGLFFAGAFTYGKFEARTQPDSARAYLQKASATAAKIKDKQQAAYNDLQAFLSYAWTHLHITQNDYASAIPHGNKALALMELQDGYQRESRVQALNFYKIDIYLHATFALYFGKRPVEEFSVPLHIGLFQLSFSDSTTRAEHIRRVRTGEINVHNFELPFDSIVNKVAADELVAARMHGTYDWLQSQDEATKTEYYPKALEAAKLRTRILEYSNQQMHRAYDKKAVFQRFFRCYETAIALCQELYQRTGDKAHLEQGVQWMENVRSMFLLSNLYESSRQKFAGIPDALIQKQDSLQTQIVVAEQLHTARRSATTQENLSQSRAQLDTLMSVFKRDYPKYYELQNQPKLPNIEQIRAQLGDSTTLLQFYEGHKHVFVFSLHRDTMSLRSFLRADYSKLLSSLIEQCARADFQESTQAMLRRYATESHQFYRDYIAPSVPAATRRLVLIADGNLHYLPLEALCTEAVSEDAESFAQLPYLVHKYSVSHQYAVSLWYNQQLKAPNKESHEMLVMAADYQFNTTAQISTDSAKSQIFRSYRPDDVRRLRPLLRPLQGTKVELEALKERFAGNFLVSEAANERQFKQEAHKYGILHLAMHSIVNEENPSRANLAFTETLDTLEDNFLMAYEIKQMQLNAQLVVLSACETGYGKYEHGEGILSIGSSFLYAGVPSLITTLWQLNDQAAPPIVLNFYAQLQNGVDKDRALQLAKIEFLKSNRSIAAHPAFWACFVQAGDYSPLKIAKKCDVSSSSALFYWLAGGLLLLLGGFVWWRTRTRR